MARLPTTLSAKERENVEKIYLAMRQQFPWDKTPQGANYWKEVNRNLYSLIVYVVYPYDEDKQIAGEYLMEAPEPPEEEDPI